MNRFELVKDFVYTKYGNIYNSNIRIAALSHTAMVVNNVTLLALRYKENVELAQISALLHDYSLFYEGSLPKNHGLNGGEFAKAYLSSLQIFTEEEISMVSHAISVHSNKWDIDSPFDEILKDADLLAKYLDNPNQELQEYEVERLKKLNITDSI